MRNGNKKFTAPVQSTASVNVEPTKAQQSTNLLQTNLDTEVGFLLKLYDKKVTQLETIELQLKAKDKEIEHLKQVAKASENEYLKELQNFIYHNVEGNIQTPLMNIHNSYFHFMDTTLIDGEIQDSLFVLCEISKILAKIPVQNSYSNNI